MITFILNEKVVATEKNAGSSLLDFIRSDAGLPGTKIGCREGDCGACTVLMGELVNNRMEYNAVVSCLTPLINAHRKHIVTIEGINLPDNRLSPVQQAMAQNAATQCGFCTPGFVVAFTGFCLSREKPTLQKAIESVSGNICRCTGYKSIERAAADISASMQNKAIDNPVEWLVNNQYLPRYFLDIPEKLKAIPAYPFQPNHYPVGGGTDLLVRQPDSIQDSPLFPVTQLSYLKELSIEQSVCSIGGAVTISELSRFAPLHSAIPALSDSFKLISSKTVRNMATIAGNLVNASPIGDFSIILLALNADICLSGKSTKRTIPLTDFFIGYKKTNMLPDEIIRSITFTLPEPDTHFSFEKVSKRQHLDIASVNCAALIRVEKGSVVYCRISAGGIAPVPLYLKKTSSYLTGKKLTPSLLNNANEVLQSEISPISDIRGDIAYKRLLAHKLIYAHFAKLYPQYI